MSHSPSLPLLLYSDASLSRWGMGGITSCPYYLSGTRGLRTHDFEQLLLVFSKNSIVQLTSNTRGKGESD